MLLLSSHWPVNWGFCYFGLSCSSARQASNPPSARLRKLFSFPNFFLIPGVRSTFLFWLSLLWAAYHKREASKAVSMTFSRRAFGPVKHSCFCFFLFLFFPGHARLYPSPRTTTHAHSHRSTKQQPQSHLALVPGSPLFFPHLLLFFVGRGLHTVVEN